MRYLKQKIAKANEHQRLVQSSGPFRKQPETPPFCEVQIKIEIPAEVKIEEDCVKKNKPKRSLGNNVMKNYANAMVNFALSRLAEPYISRSPLVKAMPVQLFRQMLASNKRKTNSIKSFRELLVIDESQDSEETKTCKSLFQEACKAFLKYFWVNWIYNSKLNDKSKYLKYRGRLLRRVENPELFTYLETFSTKKSKKQKSRGSKNLKKEITDEWQLAHTLKEQLSFGLTYLICIDKEFPFSILINCLKRHRKFCKTVFQLNQNILFELGPRQELVDSKNKNRFFMTLKHCLLLSLIFKK